MKKRNEKIDIQAIFDSATGDSISLERCDSDRNLTVKNVAIKDVQLIGCKFKGLVFEDCQFDNFMISECEFGSLKINKCFSHQYIDIQLCATAGGIVIEESQAKGAIDIGFTYCNIRIESVNAPYVSIYGEKANGTIKKLTLLGDFSESTIVRVGQPVQDLEYSSAFEVVDIYMRRITLRVTHAEIKSMLLRGAVSEKSDIIFDDILVQKLAFLRLISSTAISFNSVNLLMGDSELLIDGSSLGESRFNFCNFSAAAKFFLIDSVLDEIRSSGSQWPLFIEPERKTSSLAQPENTVRARRKSGFSQMKNIMAASGEKFFEAKYRSLELDEQMKEDIGLADKISLFISKISSNHGANWVWAIVFVLSMNLIFSGLMCLAHGGVQSLHKYFFVNYFAILNPLYRSETLFGSAASTNEAGLAFLVLVSKVFNAYMYYQIVRSFRKYG